MRAGVATRAGPRDRAAPAVLLLCKDLGARYGAPVAGELARRFASPAWRVVTGDLCGEVPVDAALGPVGAERVVAACSHGRARRDEIVAHLRRSGIHWNGIGVVDLSADSVGTRDRAARECMVRIRAVLAGVQAGDLRAPVAEKLTFGTARLSRRALLRLGPLARQPVVTWRAGPGDAGGCATCAASCPRGALSVVATGLAIDPHRCTGCGACIGACPSGALSLPGAPAEALLASVAVLARAARRAGPEGCVAIVCREVARGVPLGRGWFPLEVPSLEMVSLGWVLGLCSAGIAVRLVPCDDPACSARAGELANVSASFLSGGDGSPNGTAPDPLDPYLVEPLDTVPPVEEMTLELREPAATLRALEAMGRFGVLSGSSLGRPAVAAPGAPGAPPEPVPWVSPLSPLGEVALDTGRCSGCGSCALACSTGALRFDRQEGGWSVISFDHSSCVACCRCVAACPEGAVGVQRVVDRALLERGRQVLARRGPADRCVSCGRALAASLDRAVISARLAGSHPTLAARLADEPRCAECLLEA